MAAGRCLISIDPVRFRPPLVFVIVMIGGGACRERPAPARPAPQPVLARSPSLPPRLPVSSPTGSVTARVQPSAEALALSDAFANAAAAIAPSVVRLDVEGTTRDAASVTEPDTQQGPDLPDFLRQFFGLGAPEGQTRPVASADDAVAAMRSGRGARLLRVATARGTRLVTVTPR